jgi:hypothetical protein
MSAQCASSEKRFNRSDCGGPMQHQLHQCGANARWTVLKKRNVAARPHVAPRSIWSNNLSSRVTRDAPSGTRR